MAAMMIFIMELRPVMRVEWAQKTFPERKNKGKEQTGWEDNVVIFYSVLREIGRDHERVRFI